MEGGIPQRCQTAASQVHPGTNHQLERDVPCPSSKRSAPFLSASAASGDGGVSGRSVGGASNQAEGMREQHEWAKEITKCNDVVQGRELHARILVTGRRNDVYLCNLVIHMFGRCGSTSDATRVFANIQNPNDHSWTMLVDACVRNGNVEAAKHALDAMPRPNVVAWTLLLQAYADEQQLESAKSIFDAMPEPNVVSWTAMLSVYGSNGDVEAAGALFDDMPLHNLVSWNSLLSAYAASRHADRAQGVFDAMPERSLQSWCNLMTAFNGSGQGKRAMALFEQMPCRDVVAWNALLRAHVMEGDLDAATAILTYSMPEHTMVSWNTLITGLVQHSAAAVEVANWFHAIPEWDAVTINSMLVCYSQSGMVSAARRLFDALGIASSEVVLHTTMLLAHAQKGQLEEAKVLFDRMPCCSLVTWNAMVFAFGQSDDVHGAWGLFRQAPGRNVATWNALLGALARAGHLWAARAAFDTMPSRDSISWNTMLAAYAYLGNDEEGRQATELVATMAWEGMELDEVSCLCLLAVCNHLGLLHSSFHYLASMLSDHGLQPRKEHYNAVAGILGRSGLGDEAQVVVSNMDADAVSWTALLGTCHIHPRGQQVIRARDAAEKVAALEPHKKHLVALAIAAAAAQA